MAKTTQVDLIIERFVGELQAAMRAQLSEEVSATVQAALSGAQPRTSRSNARGARSKVATSGKRTSEEIEQLAKNIAGYIEKHPGQRSEQIAAGLNLTTKDLTLPIKKLIADKKVKSKGVARGTTYVAAAKS